MNPVELLHMLPSPEEVDLAIMANNGGTITHNKDMCECDPSVWKVPCGYCEIEHVLRRVERVVKAIVEATEKVQP